MKKQIRFIALSTLSFLVMIMVVFSSCEKQEQRYGPSTFYKPCDKVVCLNGGACSDGSCNCIVGYEGEVCEIRSIDKFIDTFLAFDNCYMQGTESYPVYITSDFNPITELTIKNLGKTCPNDLKAYITAERTNFDIPFQQSCQNYWISGEGNIYDSVLNVNIVIRDSATHTSQTCSFLMNQQ